MTENYSALRPDVLTGAEGEPLGDVNTELRDVLLAFDVLIVAGQAKSHCVADFSEAAESAFARFEAAGMHRVRSTDPLESWPGVDLSVP